MRWIAMLENGWFVELLTPFTFPFFSWRTNEKELITKWILKYLDVVYEECFFRNKFCWIEKKKEDILSTNLSYSKQTGINILLDDNYTNKVYFREFKNFIVILQLLRKLRKSISFVKT